MFRIELAAVEQQGRRAGAVCTAFHLANKDHVVALFVAAAVEAFKGGCRAIQQGCSARAFDKLHAGETVTATGGKLSCQVLLVGTQDVDGVV